MTSRLNFFIFGIVIIFVSFLLYDIDNTNFSWMAFQERDYDRSIKFLLGNGLSHLGPEASGGGNLPGPFITLIYSIPILIFKEPIGIFISLQFCYILSLVISFYLIKKYYSLELAWVSLLIMLTSSSMYMYVFSGWHAAFAPTLFLLSLVTIDRAASSSRLHWFFFTGILFGISIQFHLSSIIPILLTMLLLLRCQKAKWLKVLLYGSSGFFLTLTYYLYYDFTLDFQNTHNLLFNKGLKLEDPLSISDRIPLILKFFSTYFSRLVFGSYDAFDEYGRSAINGSTFNLLLLVIGFFKIAFLLIGLVKLILFKKNITLNYFLILFICIPFLFFRHEARWFMFSHPFFEIIVSIGILSVLNIFKEYLLNYSNIRIRSELIYPIVLSSIIFLLGQLTTNIKIIPPDSKRYSSASIYQNFYKNHVSIREVLLNDLRLSPDDYKNRFFLYRGGNPWPFQTSFQLPSWSHYKFLYDTREVSNPINLNDNGLILISKEDINNIDLSNLNVIEIKEVRNFIIIIYRNSYIYKSHPLYSDLSENENEIITVKKEFKKQIRRTKNSIEVKYYSDIDTHYKSPIKFLNKLFLKDTPDGVEGFFEIEGPTLRQSAFAEQSPHFIKNPNITLKFKNNLNYHFELFSKNLYGKQKSNMVWEVHNFYTKIEKSDLLGSLFLESPFGLEIYISKVSINDIKEIIFRIDGYGDLLFYNQEDQKRSFKTRKEFVVDLKD